VRVEALYRRDPTGWWPCVALGDGDLPIAEVLDVLAQAPRSNAWLVEISNVLPGCFEPYLVESGLAYLRRWLSDHVAVQVR
jgi:hypothetical protein